MSTSPTLNEMEHITLKITMFRMNQTEAEIFIRRAIPSVFAEFDRKRSTTILPLKNDMFDAAATINQDYVQTYLVDFNQTDEIQKAFAVVIQTCMKVRYLNLN